MREYKKDVILAVIRYLLVLTLVMTYIGFYAEVGVYYLMLMLGFIINSQLRFHWLQRQQLIIGSLVGDMVFIYLLFGVDMPFFSVFFLLSTIDALVLCRFPFMMAVNSLLMGQMIAMHIRQAPLHVGMNLVFIIICLLAIYQLKVQYEKKDEAQNLYDRLRVKEEELVELNERLEKYANTVQSLTLLKERNRITREIHDHVGHRLSATIIQLAAIEKLIFKNQEASANMVKNLREYEQETLQSVRDLINELKPKEFERYEGLVMIEQMLQNFQKLTNVEVKMSILNEESKTWELNEGQSFAIYRLIQEFLSNSVRHGQAKGVEIAFNFQEQQLILVMRDNGVGNASIIEGNGLTNMRRRVRELSGQVKYETAPNEGFFAVLTVPKESGIRGGDY